MSRPVTPATAHPAPGLGRSNSQHAGHTGSRPVSHMGGAGTGVDTDDHHAGAPQHTSVLSQSEGIQGDNPVNDASSGLQRSESQTSQSQTMVASRGGTLKKKASLKRGGSLKRSNSKKSGYAGSVRSMKLGEKEKYEPSPEHNSAFYCPVPVTGSPTELLADRFQAWRRVLKDLINYFRDLQKSYETRSKTLSSVSNVINNISIPNNFMSTDGLADAAYILRDFHKLALNEANKSKDLENEVILQLTGLRSDLQQKIKEIKSLSGDFKNSVGKEQDGTRKAVRALQDALGQVDHDAASTSGKGDPYLVKLAVDRQLEKQIEEENYLHRAYLNLEASGRELESIVVGEIQKAYNVLAGILKREADQAYEAVEKLKEGPLAMHQDHEWDEFVRNNNHMVDPRIPLRQYEQITYEGKDHPAAIEVKSGMLERKSKYLKNYTPGWYVLSPTHLHEFKSADHITYQAPIVSLYLPEQKLGTHSEPGSSSHKFMLKGRQTGTMHRGHSWIFRAETHDTMLAWYNDIKELTEKRGEARNEFVRRTHARTFSSGSMKAPSIASAESGIEEDEADQVPFAGEQSIRGQSIAEVGAPSALGETAGAHAIDDNRSESGWRPPQRPTPGGRFPSDLNVQRGLQVPLSPSSGDSFDEQDRDTIAAASALPGSSFPFVEGMSTQPRTELQHDQYQPQPHTDLQHNQHQRQPQTDLQHDQHQPQPQTDVQHNQHQRQPQTDFQHNQHQPQPQTSTYRSGNELAGAAGSASNANTQPGIQDYTAGDHPPVVPTASGAAPVETSSTYGDWMAPMAAASGAVFGAAGGHAYHQHKQNAPAENVADQMDSAHSAIPSAGHSSAPILVTTAAPIDAPTAPRAMIEPANEPANEPAATPIDAPTVPRAMIEPSNEPANELAATSIDAPTVPRATIEPANEPANEPAATSIDAPTVPRAMTESANEPASAPSATVSSGHTLSTIFSGHSLSTVPAINTLIGTAEPAPSQILLAAGIDPNPTRTTNANASSVITGMERSASPTTAPASTAPDTNYAASGVDAAGHSRPQPRSAKSVQTISDLHVPGEYPETPAVEQGSFGGY